MGASARRLEVSDFLYSEADRTRIENEKAFLQSCIVSSQPAKHGGFVYVKVHKAATTTVISTLLDCVYRELGLPRPNQNHHELHRFGDKAFQPARSLGTAEILRRAKDPRHFCFTFVRDPFARAVSAWADKIRPGGRFLKAYFNAQGAPRSEPPALSKFLDVIAQEPAVLNADRHWRPQILEAAIDQMEYDFIGDVSRLNKCLSIVTERLFGTPTAEVSDTRQIMGHATGSAALLETLTLRDRQNVERAYGDDIEFYALVSKRMDAIFAN